MMPFSKRSGALIGLLVFLIPLALFLLWVYACSQTAGYPHNVDLYQSYFPRFLRGRFTTTVLSLVLCLLAVGLSFRSLNDSNKLLKAVSWFVVTGGGLLGFLNLFSMM